MAHWIKTPKARLPRERHLVLGQGLDTRSAQAVRRPRIVETIDVGPPPAELTIRQAWRAWMVFQAERIETSPVLRSIAVVFVFTVILMTGHLWFQGDNFAWFAVLAAMAMCGTALAASHRACRRLRERRIVLSGEGSPER
jgi:hypothetical protein